MGLGALQYFQSPEMTESSIKKGQYITVESFFFPFFIQKLKRSKYITLFTYCASCLEITEKEHTDILIRETLHSLHLQILLLVFYEDWHSDSFQY